MTRRFGLAAVALCGLSGWAAGQAPTVRPPLVLPEPTLPAGVSETLPTPVELPPPPAATLPPADMNAPGTDATSATSATTSPVAPPPVPTMPPVPPVPPVPSGPAEPAAPAAAKPVPNPPVTIDDLGAQVAGLGHHLTVTTADGDFRLVLGGAVVADFLYSTTRPIATGTPFFLPPDNPFGLENRAFDAHARQTSLYALFAGPDVFDFKAGGFIFVNLYNTSIIQDRYGVLPINAYGELRNDDWRFAAGYQMDVFNPLNPTVLPFSMLNASGNAGVFRGQARVERYLHRGDDSVVTITGAVSEPVPTTLNDQLRLVSEDNGLPNVEGRIAVGLGPVCGTPLDPHRAIEAGVSALCGQVRSTEGPTRVVADVWGLGADARWAADPRWGVQGEVYIGQGLGSYGTSGLQIVNPVSLRAIRTAGAWIEGFYYWCPDAVHTHVGYGIDDPLDGDVGPFLPLRNETYYVTTIWDVTRAFRVAFQASYLRTAYPVVGNNEGFVFQTQFQWKF